MRRIRLLMIAIASFFGTIIGEGLVRRAIALLMCGVFSFNSTACYASFGNTGELAIAQIPRVRQQNQPSDEREFSERQKPQFKNPSSFEESPNTVNNYSLFTPSFKRLSDNKVEIKLASKEGCNFVITLNKNKDFVYEESIQFISPSIEVCQIEPFISRFSPDGRRIEVKTNDTQESLIIEQISESAIKRILTKSTGETLTDTVEIPKNLRRFLKQQPLDTQPQAFKQQKFIQKLSNSSLFKSQNELLKNSQLNQYAFSSRCLAVQAGDKFCDIVSITSATGGGSILPEKTVAKLSAKWLMRLTAIGWISDVACFAVYGGVIPPVFATLESLHKYNVYWLKKRGFARLAAYLEKSPLLEKTTKLESIADGFLTNLEEIINIKKVNDFLDQFKFSGILSDFLEKCEQNSTSEKPIAHSGKQVKGTSYGDPHLITFDGYRYSFQTVGEFILAKSSDRVFEVQTRQSPVNRSLSLNSAVAMRVGNTRVAFYSKDFPDSDTSTPLRVNGKPTVIRDKSLSLPGGGSINKQNDNNYVVQWATGEKVAVTIYSRGQFQYMDVFPFVFESQANQMVGLLGNVNGKENDDLRFRSGDILPSKSTYGNLNQLIQGVLPIRLPLGQLEKIYFDQLNKDFGNNWRVSTEESLFDYPAGKSSKTFTDKAFPDAYLTLDMLSPNQLQTARSQCLNAGVQASLLEGCVFDVGFTGYSEFAARTAQVSNILNIVESVIPGFKNPIPEIIRKLPKIPGLPF